VSDYSVKSRLRYAKEKRKKRCIKEGARIIQSDNKIICLIAQYDTNERKMRVVVDKITPYDIELLQKISVFPYQSREIWCSTEGVRDEFGIALLNDGDTIKILYDPICEKNHHRLLSIPEFFDTYYQN